MDIKKTPENANNYVCEYCDFECYKKSDWNRHIARPKHKNNEKRYKMVKNDDIKTQENAGQLFHCKCGKKYMHYSGLWRHQQKCKGGHDELDVSTLDMNLIMNLLKQNDEFKGLMLEQNNKMMETFQEVCKNGINNNSVTQVNSHNKTFNLNVFLNEQCKDAMNIMEFVDSIKLDLSDAEMVGKLGYINGISHIIIKHLKALDVHMRPVHCTDLKRETLYVKYQDVWEKEGDDNKLIRKAIKHISSKNHNAAETFKEIHPDCMEYNSKHGDHFLNLRIEALGGSGNDSYEGHSKIIKKIAKEVTIDKTC